MTLDAAAIATHGAATTATGTISGAASTYASPLYSLNRKLAHGLSFWLAW
jgi:hypothetical protein